MGHFQYATTVWAGENTAAVDSLPSTFVFFLFSLRTGGHWENVYKGVCGAVMGKKL